MKRFAEQLMAHEMTAHPSRGMTPAPAFLVCERLHPTLATLLGTVGFSALLGRALALASAEVPWLRGVQLEADGSCAEPQDIKVLGGAAEVSRGSTILLAHLLGLLVSFIGEELSVRLMRDIWPSLPSDVLARGKGTEDEKSS